MIGERQRRASAGSGARRALVGIAVGIALLGAVAAPAAASSPVTAAYAGPNGTLHVRHADGSTASLGASASAIGPAADLTGDGSLDVPYVTSNGALKAVGTGGTTTTLVTSGVRSSKTRLAVGDLNGDGTPSVLYPATQHSGHVYAVESGSSPREAVAASASAVLGYADLTGDGTKDVVFVGTSGTVKYAEGGTVSSTGYSSVGSNNGLGAGAVADFDGDGTARVAVVDGSNQLRLVSANGSATTLATDAAKAPTGAANVTGSSAPDVLYATTNGKLGYATAAGRTGAFGASVEPAVGVVGRANPESAGGSSSATTTSASAPNVTDVSLANPTGRTLRVAVTTDERLDSLSVRLSGPDGTTLSRSDFSVSGSGPYTYVATTTRGADGTYTATVRTAAANGTDGADGQQASATVRTDTAKPTVSDATVTAADGGDVVGAGGELDVSAVVTGAENVTVEANASAYGAGTVRLHHASGSVYRATVTADAGNGTGDVPVTARTPGGATASDTGTGPVLDTTPPTAEAGADRNATPGTVVGFDARASSDDTGIANATWTFPDGTVVHGATATHAFDATGNYTVRLRVRDAAGNAATDTRTIHVRPPSELASDANVSVSRAGSAVTAHVRNATSARPVHVSVHGDASAAASLDRVTVTADASSFALTVTSSTGAPNGTPAVSSALPARAVGYYRVAHTVSDRNVSAAVFHASVNASAVSSPDAVALYRYHGGSWRRLATTVENVSGGRVHVSAHTTGFSTYAVGERRPQFAVTNATLDASTTATGSSVGIDVTVRNSGSANGTATLPVSFDGETVATRNVSVPAGRTRNVTLSVTPHATGADTVTVANEHAGDLTVTSGTSAVMQAVQVVGVLAALCLLAAGVLYTRDYL